MKKTLLFLLIAISVLSFSQTTKSFMWDGTNRQYIEYVPSIYTGTEGVPLVICLHGLGDDMTNFSGIGMQTLSEYENFIVLTPQALVAYYMSYEIGTAWNSGASYSGIVLNQDVDDVGFLGAMIDSTMELYNIDPDRIYVTGFSMGGFMSHRLACVMNDKLAAIASVAGTIGNNMTDVPALPMPVCHFHGTADTQVAYTGNDYGNDAEELVSYWVTKNNCNTTPIVSEALPDVVADGYTVDHYIYGEGDYSTEVEFYKVTGANHVWLFEPDNDISYTLKIWEFFSRHSRDAFVNIENKENDKENYFYPNPASDFVYFYGNGNGAKELTIYNFSGAEVLKESSINSNVINVSDLLPGIYVFSMKQNDNIYRQKITIMK